MIDECISGGISGAITDQYSEDAIQYASQKYDSIRKQTGDCERIAKNTGYSIQQINFIKNYLFFDKHYLNSFNETLYKRFDPEFTIAQSWERLSSRKREIIKKHDLLFLKHELKEIECITKTSTQFS